MTSVRRATLGATVGGTLTGFDPNDTRGHAMVAVVWTMVPFAMVTVILRMYCRYFLSKNLGIDDWMACWSMLLVFITGCVMTYMTKHGLGVHKEFLDDEQRRYYNMLFYVSIVFYISSLYFIKMHVLLQYLRLFSIKMRKLTLWVMGGVGFYGTASIFISIFKCNPIAGFWDPRLNALCIPTMPNWYLNGIGNIVTDIIVFALPLRVLWNLKLNRATRLSLIGVFSLGFFTVCVSVVRLTFLDILKGDETYQNVMAASWTISELCCGIIVSCAPCLRPLLKRVFPSLRDGSSDPNSGANNYIRTINGHKYQFDDLEAAKASASRRSKIMSGTTLSSGSRGPLPNIDTSHRRVNSTDMHKDDLDLLVDESVGSPTPTTEKRPRRDSVDSGSGTDGVALPIQGTPLKPLRYNVTPPSQSQRGSRDDVSGPRDVAADEQFLGLRLGTHTTVNAGGRSPSYPTSAVLADGGGIRVKREFVQRSGPS